MRLFREVSGNAVVIAAMIVVASCGGSDAAAPDTIEPTATTLTSDAAPGESTGAADDTSTAPGTADSSADSTAPATTCAGIFSTAEIDEFFGEPTEVTEETDDSLGQLVCTWESIEDPDNTEDLAFKILTVQLYSGTPIPASSFFDPSFLEAPVTIADVGDLAYSSDDFGASFYFVDEPVGGSLSFTEVDMGDADAPKLRSRSDVENLFRTFHDRVA